MGLEPSLKFSAGAAFVLQMALVLASCGGGSGGGSALGNAQFVAAADTTVQPPADGGTLNGVNTGVNLGWDTPGTRMDGTPLASEEIAGYVLFFLPQKDIGGITGTIADRIPSLATFVGSGAELGQFVSTADIAELVTAGALGVIFVPAPQLAHRLELPAGGTYYVAVSAYDWEGLYSPLSETIAISR